MNSRASDASLPSLRGKLLYFWLRKQGHNLINTFRNKNPNVSSQKWPNEMLNRGTVLTLPRVISDSNVGRYRYIVLLTAVLSPGKKGRHGFLRGEVGQGEPQGRAGFGGFIKMCEGKKKPKKPKPKPHHSFLAPCFDAA